MTSRKALARSSCCLGLGLAMLAPLAGFAGGLIVPAAAGPEMIDQVIVRYVSDPTDAQLGARMRAAQNAGSARGVALSHLRRGALGIHVLKLNRKMSVADAEKLAAAIEAGDPNVEYAEPDRIMQATFTPNDTRYNEQWHYFEATAGVNLPAAWDFVTGTGIRVAVIDTGYRPHADLAANIIGGYDFITSTFTSRRWKRTRQRRAGSRGLDSGQ